MKTYAIVPARSGSKGLSDKNIRLIAGRPLISYSIDFAKRIPSIDRVFCSTDSEYYAALARESGAEVPFLRSSTAAVDSAMEEDILRDLRAKFSDSGIDEPDIVVWLRPTFVFRSVEHVSKCINTIKNESAISAARTVVKAENRLYHIVDGCRLLPNFDDAGKSMMRRQDLQASYRVFSTDVFRFKGNEFENDFLGKNIFAVETNEICGLDVDDLLDFEIIRNLIENSKELANDFL